MKCNACERGDHDQCGMQSWCSCDCEGYDPGGSYVPDGHYFHDDLDGGRLVKKVTVFTHCNVCGTRLRDDEEEAIGMCHDCADWSEK